MMECRNSYVATGRHDGLWTYLMYLKYLEILSQRSINNHIIKQFIYNYILQCGYVIDELQDKLS